MCKYFTVITESLQDHSFEETAFVKFTFPCITKIGSLCIRVFSSKTQR